MSTHQPRPTLLFVHGAWHGSWCWDPLVALLGQQGWTTRSVDLPSVASGGRRCGLHDDAQVVRDAINDIGRPVVVIAHSYGGMPVTEGAAGNPLVSHIIYLAAFMLDEGRSVLDAVGGHLPPWWDVHDDVVTAQQPRTVFYNDLPEREAEQAAARLRPHSLAAFTDDLAAAAWKTTPTTYVVCDCDQAIPPAAQIAMSAAATSVQHLRSGHSSYLSHRGDVAAIIRAAAQGDQAMGPTTAP